MNGSAGDRERGSLAMKLIVLGAILALLGRFAPKGELWSYVFGFGAYWVTVLGVLTGAVSERRLNNRIDP